jgi:broad specificity phosphatase PhoE
VCRHGEGEHNTATDDYGEWAYYAERWRDAQLTDNGREQASAVGQELAAKAVTIDLICASPLTRTLQTAQYIAAQLPAPPPIVALEAVRERLDGAQPANARRQRSVLQAAYPGVNFSALADEDDSAFAKVQRLVRDRVVGRAEAGEEPALHTLANYGFSRTRAEEALATVGHEGDELARTSAAVRWLRQQAGEEPLFTEWTPYEDDGGTSVRVASFLTWLAARPEAEILVSTHCMFLYTLFGRSAHMAEVMLCDPEVDGSYFGRGECRTVQMLFDPSSHNTRDKVRSRL